jgi:4-hydroxythreonine-4-phosphate dehydrogenase
MTRPRIALTLGDVAGIGPEVVVRAWCDPTVHAWCRPVVVGHPDVVQRAAKLLGAAVDVRPIEGIIDGEPTPGTILCWNPTSHQAAEVPPGRNDGRAGQAACEYLSAAAAAALAGQIDAITTAPLSKAALQMAGLHYPGHTEILAELCSVRHYAMMLYLTADAKTPSAAVKPPETAARPSALGVVHVTLHTSLRSVPELVTLSSILEKIRLIDRFLRDVGCVSPRIAVCALNPHAGEEGLFGDEEAREIAPAVVAAVAEGIDAAGPFPADTLLRRAHAGQFDGVVAMYHDQGHIALKLIGFNRAVNVTLGLPIVRTSPSHGTAFDIAWQGKASGGGMVEAVRVAATLAMKKRAAPDEATEAAPVDSGPMRA